jgi:hypothetical protein
LTTLRLLSSGRSSAQRPFSARRGSGLTSRRDEIAGPLIANARIAGERGGPLRRIPNFGQIGQLVNDDLGFCVDDRRRQPLGVEYVDQDRMRAEAAQKLHPFRRACFGSVGLHVRKYLLSQSIVRRQASSAAA